MRMINRTITTKETENMIETTIVESIVENEELKLQFMKPEEAQEHLNNNMGVPSKEPDVLMLRCNICTAEFKLDYNGNGRCPTCGSRDVSLL